MKIYFFILCFILFKVLSGCNSTENNNNKDFEIYRGYLKEVVFCYCIKEFFKGDSLIEYDGSMDEYFQMDVHSIETANEIFNLTDNYIKENRNNLILGRNLYIKKCIDYRNSHFLDSVVKAYDNDIRDYHIRAE